MNTHLYKDRKYEVVRYDSHWPVRFEKYALQIRTIFGDIQIEHIGSTSVPGMSGKACIDVLAIVKDLKVADEHVGDMEKAGFESAGQFVTENSRLFRVMNDEVALANIHFFPVGHPHIVEMLNLRDYLRNHPEEVAAYSKIKEDLYAKYHDDYASYRKHKDDYMADLKKRVSSAL